MMYYPTTFGCKKINSSVSMVEKAISNHMSPQYDFDLEDTKPISLHDTLGHDDASPNQV